MPSLRSLGDRRAGAFLGICRRPGGGSAPPSCPPRVCTRGYYMPPPAEAPELPSRVPVRRLRLASNVQHVYGVLDSFEGARAHHALGLSRRSVQTVGSDPMFYIPPPAEAPELPSRVPVPCPRLASNVQQPMASWVALVSAMSTGSTRSPSLPMGSWQTTMKAGFGQARPPILKLDLPRMSCLSARGAASRNRDARRRDNMSRRRTQDLPGLDECDGSIAGMNARICN
jgi:hypothetical protein